MLCVPSLGSESLVLESCNRSYNGLDVTVLISSPTSKSDVGRLGCKKHCNHISSGLNILQQGTGIPSSVAGIRHCGSKALTWSRSPNVASVNGPSEQALSALKRSMISVDVGRQSQKAQDVHFVTGSELSQQDCSKLKPSKQSLEAQLAEFERVRYQSQALCSGTHLSEEAQETHAFDISMTRQMEGKHVVPRSESFNHALRSTPPSLQQSLQQQVKGVHSPAPQVDHSRSVTTGLEKFVVSDFSGNEPVWNQSFPRIQRAHSSLENVLDRSVDTSEQVFCQLVNAGINEFHHCDEFNALQGIMGEDDIRRNAHTVDVCEPRRHLPNAIQHFDKEDQCTGDKHLVNGFNSYSQSFRAASSYPDSQLSGSMNSMSVNDFHFERHGYGFEWQIGGEQILKSTKVEEMQAKEATNASSALCKVAAVRMPGYRTSTHLQHSRSDSIFYLESLGADCSRLFRDDPSAMTCTVKQLRVLVCALERYGLKWNDLGRIFNLCPRVLHLKPENDLKIVTSFLFDEVGLPRKDLGKVIRRCPRLLVADVNGQLRPTLSFLRSLGYSKMGHVISNNPTLLSCSVEMKLIPKLRFLEGLGFTYREAATMVVRFPAIFNYSISENLQPKYAYLIHNMGGRNKDLLAFPQYFGYSLETRIQPRHQCIIKYDVSFSIQAILKLSDAEFSAKFSCGGGHSHLSKKDFVRLETSDVKFQDCSLDSLKFLSFEHPETRVLVSV